MNNIDILEDYIELIEKGYCEDCNELCNISTAPSYPSKAVAQAISTLIAENKELKEEIEELKENNGYHLGFIDGGIVKRYEYEDKIKAKIEEVEQWGLYNMKIPKLSTLDERLGAKIGIKYVLQSLLRKE